MTNTIRLEARRLSSAWVILPSPAFVAHLLDRGHDEAVFGVVARELRLQHLRVLGPLHVVGSSANARYSESDCVPNSTRSMRKTTLSASWESAMSWADLKLVMVLRAGGMPNITARPPTLLFGLSSHLHLRTLSDMAAAA